MDMEGNDFCNQLLCFACLHVGRDVRKITDEKLIQYYADILDEIPLKKSRNIGSYVVCCECKAMLQKCCTFRDHVKDSYRILQTYTKEQIHRCLKDRMMKPPRLKIKAADSVSIPPSRKVDHSGSIEQVVKSDVVEEWIKDDRPINMADMSNNFNNDHLDPEEQLEAELQTIISSFEREDQKIRIDKPKLKGVKKIKKANVKEPEECLPSEVPPPRVNQETVQETVECTAELVTENDIFEETSLEVKSEVADQWDCLKDDTNIIKEDDITDDFSNGHIEEGIMLETELETIMSSIEKADRISKEVKIKEKKSKKILKSLNLKQSKLRKYRTKVQTVDLTYEELMLERENESKRDAYVNAKFKCDTCLIVFNYKKSYQAHVNAKHLPELGEYICPICKTIFSAVESFTFHYKRHMRRYQCGECHKRTADLKVMQQHYFAAHDIVLKEYTCNICGHVSHSVDAHAYHKGSHKARLPCTLCDKTFRHRSALSNHRHAVHDSQTSFACSVCDKSFRWKTSLKRHMDETHEAKKIALPYCSTCGIDFASISSYQRHMKNSLKHISVDQLRYTCDHCKKKFADKTKLRDHIEEVHLNKTYLCPICLKSFKARMGLDQHIRYIHKGRPKNKLCHHCGRGFPTKIQLECHIRSHTGERPYSCEYCPTTFAHKSNMNKHYRRMHLKIKSKRHAVSNKSKENTSEPTPPVENPSVEGDPFRPVVLQYSPERDFVL